MIEIKCPYDLNQFILGEPIFENPFPEEECEKRKFYGDCYHCFSTAIASRDHQLEELQKKPRVGEFIVTDEKDELYSNVCICTECGKSDVGAGNYCRWCGVKLLVNEDA